MIRQARKDRTEAKMTPKSLMWAPGVREERGDGDGGREAR